MTRIKPMSVRSDVSRFWSGGVSVALCIGLTVCGGQVPRQSGAGADGGAPASTTKGSSAEARVGGSPFAGSELATGGSTVWEDGGVAAAGGIATGSAGGSPSNEGAGGFGRVASGGAAGGSTIPMNQRDGGDSGGSDLGLADSAQDAACDWDLLWEQIRYGAVGGVGKCEQVQDDGAPARRLRGAAIFDSEGRVIDNTGLSGQEKQNWLDRVGSSRWPCLAGQALQYRCHMAE